MEIISKYLDNENVVTKKTNGLSLYYFDGDEFENVPASVIIENGKIISASMKRIQEFNKNNENFYEEIVGLAFGSDGKVFYYEEGTMVKIYYYRDEWVVSTNKCIDNRSTYIPMTDTNISEIFFEIAEKAFDIEKLEKDRTYCFILSHPINRCIIRINDERLIYIGNTKTDGTNIEYNNCYDDETLRKDIVVKDSRYIKSLTRVTNKKCFYALMDPMSFVNYDKKGYIIVNPKMTYAVTCMLYDLALKLRGTNPLPKMRYLELNTNDERKAFKSLFEDEIGNIEKEFSNKIREILNAYRKVKITKELHYNETGKFKKIIYSLHGIRIKTGLKINYDIVCNELFKLSIKEIGWIMDWLPEKRNK